MIYSRTYPKDTPMACPKCVWNKDEHSSFCEKRRTAHCNRCGRDLPVGEVDTHHSCWELDEQIRRDFSNGQITMQRLAEKYPEQLVYSGGVNQKEKEARECPRHPQSPMMLKGNQWSCVVCDAIGIAADVFRERFQCAPQWEGTAKGHPLHRK